MPSYRTPLGNAPESSLALPAAVKVVDGHHHARARHVLTELSRRIPEQHRHRGGLQARGRQGSWDASTGAVGTGLASSVRCSARQAPALQATPGSSRACARSPQAQPRRAGGPAGHAPATRARAARRAAGRSAAHTPGRPARSKGTLLPRCSCLQALEHGRRTKQPSVLVIAGRDAGRRQT